MKENYMKKWAHVATAMVAFLLLTACAGTAARQEVLLPTIRIAWQSIRSEATREQLVVKTPTGDATIACADEALTAGDTIWVAAVDWTAIEALAEGDVARRAASGEIGHGVAESLREMHARFRDAVTTYIRSAR